MQAGPIAPALGPSSTFGPIVLRATGLALLIAVAAAGWHRFGPPPADAPPARASLASATQQAGARDRSRAPQSAPAPVVMEAQARPPAPTAPLAEAPAKAPALPDRAARPAEVPASARIPLSLVDVAPTAPSFVNGSPPLPLPMTEVPATPDPEADRPSSAKVADARDPDAVLVTNTTSPRGPVDLNTATLEELNALRGARLIGRAVIRGRPYASAEDLVRKRVLTRSTYERVKNEIIVR